MIGRLWSWGKSKPLIFRSGKDLPNGERGPGIVFVHGLSSNPADTWKEMIAVCATDPALANHTLDCYAYPTQKFRLPFRARMASLHELADGLATELNARHEGRCDLTLVGHSLGGLVARQYVLNEVKAGRKPLLSRLLLYAVPNNGAGLAHAAQHLSWNHRHLSDLCRDSSALRTLNDDWVTFGVEDNLRVKYVVGGADMVVTPESARGHHGNNKHEMLIGRDHQSIVKAINENDTSFLLLKGFVLPSSKNSNELISLNPNTRLEGTRRVADPLFEIYHSEHEPYYLQRRIDDLLLAYVATHIWISGKSGIGKTAALRRQAAHNGHRIYNILLASYQEIATPLGLFRAICIELADQQGSGDIPDKESNLPTLIAFFRKVVRSLPNTVPVTILIEEIPLPAGALYSEFLTIVLHMLQALEVEDTLQVGSPSKQLAFSSIHHPTADIAAGMPKLRERMHFMPLAPWTDGEAHALIDLICVALQLNLTAFDRDGIVAAAKGSPRFIKMVIHKWRTGHHGSNLAKILSMVTAEQV